MTGAIIIALAFLALYDIKTHRLPNVVMFPLILAACLVTGHWWFMVLGFFTTVVLFWSAIGNQQLGEGDCKLGALLGGCFGWIGILGIIGGVALVMIIRYLTTARKTMAFSPFALLATAICILSDQAITVLVR